MKILAIDTSTHACSAALYVDGEIPFHFYRVVPRLHGELLLPMIDDLLKASGITLSDLDALAYGRGPGSFTGVRLAASCIQGLAVGVGKPVVAISSLCALAHTFYKQLGYTNLACAFDARMHEVYWGAYQLGEGEWTLLGEEQVIAPTLVPALSCEWIGVGDGWGSYSETLSVVSCVNEFFPRCYPMASSVAELGVNLVNQGKILEPADVLPIYLRDKVTF